MNGGEWWNYVNCASTAIFEEPKNIKEAYSGHDSCQWKNATDSEYDFLLNNHTWDSVGLPKVRMSLTANGFLKLNKMLTKV